MAWIRGTPRHRIHKEVEKWLKRMDLTRYKHVTIKCYSGGTKRKLNTAIAMVCFCSKFLYCRKKNEDEINCRFFQIAVPQLILLDEPTTGVDPVSRRFMWNCIQDCQKSNKNIVLTSHKYVSLPTFGKNGLLPHHTLAGLFYFLTSFLYFD